MSGLRNEFVETTDHAMRKTHIQKEIRVMIIIIIVIITIYFCEINRFKIADYFQLTPMRRLSIYVGISKYMNFPQICIVDSLNYPKFHLPPSLHKHAVKQIAAREICKINQNRLLSFAIYLHQRVIFYRYYDNRFIL